MEGRKVGVLIGLENRDGGLKYPYRFDPYTFRQTIGHNRGVAAVSKTAREGSTPSWPAKLRKLCLVSNVVTESGELVLADASIKPKRNVSKL